MSKERKENRIVMAIMIAIIIFVTIIGVLCINKGFQTSSAMENLLEEKINLTMMDYLYNLSWYFLAFVQVMVITKILNQILLWKKGYSIASFILRYISLN